MSQSTSCPSAISQVAAQAALEGDQSSVTQMVDIFKARRDLIVRRLNDIPGISCAMPDGAFYVYANVQGLIGRTGPAGGIEDRSGRQPVLPARSGRSGDRRRFVRLVALCTVFVRDVHRGDRTRHGPPGRRRQSLMAD